MNMKHLYTSLDSGVTSGSVTDNSITDDSVIEVYFDNTDCYIDTTSQSGHTVYFTVGGNTTGTNVCVVVNNLTDFTPYDDTNINQRVNALENGIDTIETEVDTISTELEERVPDDTILGGVLYHGTTGNSWKKLDASSINYDNVSTIYSAMGDIDELETTSKNLVGAINEVKESGGGGGQSYSTTEQVIGTWIDGKPLYRKCFNMGLLLSNATIEKPLNITNGFNVCKLYGIIISTITSMQSRPLPMVGGSDTTNNVRLDTNGNNIRCITYGNWNNYNAIVIVEYTKVGD